MDSTVVLRLKIENVKNIYQNVLSKHIKKMIVESNN